MSLSMSCGQRLSRAQGEALHPVEAARHAAAGHGPVAASVGEEVAELRGGEGTLSRLPLPPRRGTPRRSRRSS